MSENRLSYLLSQMHFLLPSFGFLQKAGWTWSPWSSLAADVLRTCLLLIVLHKDPRCLGFPQWIAAFQRETCEQPLTFRQEERSVSYQNEWNLATCSYIHGSGGYYVVKLEKLPEIAVWVAAALLLTPSCWYISFALEKRQVAFPPAFCPQANLLCSMLSNALG